MKEFTPLELRELDAWIEKQIFDRHDVEWGDFQGGISWDSNKRCPRDFTTNKADSMQLFDALIKHFKKAICFYPCTEGVEVYFGGSDYIRSTVKAATLPLAISVFARKNFKP